MAPNWNQILDAAAGLTRYEAEGAFALSIARHNAIRPETIWELKAQALRKNNLLTLHRGGERFGSLGGLAGMKDFCRRALQGGRNVRPRGVLLLGVPGSGKSAFAKALGNETGRPTLILDIGALLGSLVGQTEQNIRLALRIADAMAPCILFVDELEKGLAGIGGQGDSGVSTRLSARSSLAGREHESDVFFIGTANDISKLPPGSRRPSGSTRSSSSICREVVGRRSGNVPPRVRYRREPEAAGRRQLDRRRDQGVLPARGAARPVAGRRGKADRAGRRHRCGGDREAADVGQRPLPVV